MKSVQLTKTQLYWKKHVIVGMQSGSTLQRYANQQGLKVKALYDWKHRLIKMGALDDNKRAPVAFQKVQIASADYSSCTITLPNGITIEWPTGVVPAALGLMLAEITKLS
jgi:hypothetical protein